MQKVHNLDTNEASYQLGFIIVAFLKKFKRAWSKVFTCFFFYKNSCLYQRQHFISAKLPTQHLISFVSSPMKRNISHKSVLPLFSFRTFYPSSFQVSLPICLLGFCLAYRGTTWNCRIPASRIWASDFCDLPDENRL